MTRDQAAELARAAGFSHWGVFPANELVFLPEVREMCAADKCGRYDKNWSCPPACGTLEECEKRAGAYDWGVLLQTTAEMEDDFDVEAMMEADRLHRERFSAFLARLGPETDRLPLGAGSCAVCDICTWPDAPCRFPGRMTPSMEAYGLQVSDVCRSAGIAYYYGPRTITYTCCVLFPEEP